LKSPSSLSLAWWVLEGRRPRSNFGVSVCAPHLDPERDGFPSRLESPSFDKRYEGHGYESRLMSHESRTILCIE
jgi:hypothetical protein